MNSYWHIVPRGDGYHYLCTHPNTGDHYLGDKSNDADVFNTIIFASKEKAQEYINTFLNDTFNPEKCWMRLSYWKKEVIQ